MFIYFFQPTLGCFCFPLLAGSGMAPKVHCESRDHWDNLWHGLMSSYWMIKKAQGKFHGGHMIMWRSCDRAPSSAGWNQGIPRRPSLPPGGTKYVDTFQLLCVLDIVCCLFLSVLVMLNADLRTPSVAAVAAAAATTNWCSSRTFRVLVQFLQNELQDCVGVFSMVLVGWLCCCCCYRLLIGSWSPPAGPKVGWLGRISTWMDSSSPLLCVCVCLCALISGTHTINIFFFVISGMWHFSKGIIMIMICVYIYIYFTFNSGGVCSSILFHFLMNQSQRSKSAAGVGGDTAAWWSRWMSSSREESLPPAGVCVFVFFNYD